MVLRVEQQNRVQSKYQATKSIRHNMIKYIRKLLFICVVLFQRN